MPALLFIPGLHDSPRVMRRIRNYFDSKGFHVHVLAITPNDASISIHQASKQVRKYIEQIPEEKIILIGFSMGGIIARYFTQAIDKGARVQKLITLGSPHHGTLLAHFFKRDGMKDMRFKSKLLNELNSNLTIFHKIPFLSIWTPFDLMIIPAVSSNLPGIENKIIPTLTHPGLISRTRVFEAIEKFIR